MTNDDEDPSAGIRELVDAEEAPDRLVGLCRAAVRLLPASGVGVSVMTDAGVQGTAAASDPTSARLEELQFTLGEGPCIDAFALRRPVLTSVLDGGASARWPAYAPAAHEAGVRAVFAFPIQLGAARLGVLDVYRDRPGGLAGPAIAQALVFAETALELLLSQQAEASPGPGPAMDSALDHRAEVFQAQGMVMVQLGGTLAEAMVRLRAYAFAHDRNLTEVARDVLARRLVLERDTAFGEDPGQPEGSADA